MQWEEDEGGIQGSSVVPTRCRGPVCSQPARGEHVGMFGACSSRHEVSTLPAGQGSKAAERLPGR